MCRSRPQTADSVCGQPLRLPHLVTWWKPRWSDDLDRRDAAPVNRIWHLHLSMHYDWGDKVRERERELSFVLCHTSCHEARKLAKSSVDLSTTHSWDLQCPQLWNTPIRNWHQRRLLNSDASISDVVHSQMCTSIHLVLRGEKTRQVLGGSIHHSFMIFTVLACDIVHADKCCCQVWTNIDTLGNASVLVSTFIQKDAVYMIRFSCM